MSDFSLYVRVNPDHPEKIQVRTTTYTDWQHQEWPIMGFSGTGGIGCEPEAAREFAVAILAAADEAEKNAKRPMPIGWPPQSGDLWKSPGRCSYEYFVQGNQIYSDVPGDKQDLADIVREVEKDGKEYTLVHRKGQKKV